MRRSTLQRKDRSELNQIATALGAKPSSRARKDQIIQMIIELTSGEGRVSQLAEVENSEAAADAGGGEDRAGADRRRADRDDAQRADQGNRAAGDRRAGDRSDRAGDDQRAGDQRANDQRADDQRANDRADDVEPGNQRANDRADDVEPGNQRANDRADDVEPGNRRRRRRNRDRDRDRDDGWDGDPVAVSGRLDLRDEGYGFLRVDGCLPNRNDAYVPVKTIRQFGLRRGDQLSGMSRPANRAEKNPALLTLDSINDGPAEFSDRSLFEALTPIHAVRRLTLEQPENPDAVTARLVDLVAPIGVGQRVLVKGPRRSGASGLLAAVIASIEANEPDMYVMGLFLDQRPEDITEVRRFVRNGEVAATSFDQTPEDHVQTAEMTVERAKRLVESGRNVAVVLDGITALAQAFNAALSNAGRAYSGNVESGAVHMPKKLFGAGRNISEGGSLTMIASITSDGSDPVQAAVCAEFVGTANTEIHLDRWAAQRGLYPAIDIGASLSRDEHRFLDADEVQALQGLRRSFVDGAGDGPAAMVKTLEAALARLRAASTNADLLC